MAVPAIIANDAQPWSTLNGKLHDGLLRGLQEGMGYKWMSAVQYKVLSELPSLQSDCAVRAKTGTGKTIAFLLPALQSLLTQRSLPRGQVAILILSPTRELALQIAKECDALTSQLQPRLECHTAYGGTSKESALKRFCNGDPKIVVATPGRLNDYLSDDFIRDKFADMRTLVLDEADQMLEAGFLPAINQILSTLPPKSRGWQGMCFSATIPKPIETILTKVLKPGYTRLSTIDPDETPTIDKVTQHSIIVPSVAEVYPMLLILLQREYELSPDNFKCIVFGATANGVALMYALFSQVLASGSIQLFQLQSRLSQNARTKTTNEFKAASAGIMFASDVIGRGMDFPNVGLVIQVGLPSSGDQYVHRVGRTARAGNEGKAVILLTQRESFFVKVNKRLPISPYPEDLAMAAEAQFAVVEKGFDSVEETTKAKAYQAWLGFHKASTKQLQLTNEGLVREANEYAAAIGCPEPPTIDKKTVGKMGLKGVKGLNVGQVLGKAGQGVQEEASGGSFASAARRGRNTGNAVRTNGDARQGSGGGQSSRGGRGGRRGGKRGGG